ncbi:MAG: DUF2098 domain-containing protein [Methanomicrobiales archaeon]|nr:DUF2098 domain-containing protein [Methanomicrobiales archaeon]
MQEEISVGMRVRYPRTGTMGRVERLETIDRQRFAQLDSTQLLYRVDQLIPIEEEGAIKREKKEDLLKEIEREREQAAALRDELTHVDEMCDGGG